MTERALSLAARAAVGLVVLATAVCLVNGSRRIDRPFPGFLVAPNRTVFSIGSDDWSIASVPRAFFSQVIAVDGRPITRADEIQAAIADRAPGALVNYRFREGAELFAAPVEVQRFTPADFLSVYGTYAAVGLVFAVTGLIAWERGRRAREPAVVAFFALCQAVGFALGTAGDVYGPYWLVPLYFAAQCTAIAALLHLALSFPQPIAARSRWRGAAIAALYGAALLLACGLLLAGDDATLFVPLLYVVYLLLANAIVLYFGRLMIALGDRMPAERRRQVRRALGGGLLAVGLPAMIFLVYPMLHRSISPLVLVAPLALFPLLTAGSLPVVAGDAPAAGETSVRGRLALLFLGAVETSFLVAVAVFWQSQSWVQLLDDLTLVHRQRAAVDRLVAAGPASWTPERLHEVAVDAQSIGEAALARAAADAAGGGDPAVARTSLEALAKTYDDAAARVDARRRWISALDVPVLAILLGLALLQAAFFMRSIRRWLMAPLDRVAAATSVIATGDLAHRLEPEASEEFSRLRRAVNAMAASLQRIQRRVELARAARQRAAGAARDAERRRLARELHDGVLQDLSVVRLRLEAADDVGAAEGRRASVGAIASVIATIRRVVDDLRPAALSSASLADAIAGHARVLAFAQGVEIRLHLEGAAAVPDWASRDVYRVAQEATANALRHAAPKRLEVRVSEANDGVVLEVEDDGVGFDPEASALGSGVLGMRERAAALGADLEIRRRTGGGTIVRLVLPLRPPPAPSP